MRIFKYFLVFTLFSGILFQSCETTQLEDLASPNALSPDDASADLLFNQVQLNFLSAMGDMQTNGAWVSRLQVMSNRVYENVFAGGTVSASWSALYSGIIPDLQSIESQNDDGLLNFHVGASKAMAAHILMGIVDAVGDVPWSQANNPSEYPQPSVDDDADVYEAAFMLLEESEGILNSAFGTGGATDLFFNGDVNKWIKYVNTLKLRYYLTTRNWSAALAQDNVISSPADDMQFNYGTSELLPDTRHPFYRGSYTDNGASGYMSSWLLDLMDGDREEWFNAFGDITYPGLESLGDGAPQRHIESDDPRRRYYFYRQAMTTPGQASLIWFSGNGPYIWPMSFTSTSQNYEATADGAVLDCSIDDPLLVPAHLQNTPDGDEEVQFGSSTFLLRGRWCANFLGYWGRHHGDDQGIPPDQFKRTTWGVYPAGGSFDNMPDVANTDAVVPEEGEGLINATADDVAGAVGLGDGGGGAGIWPIYLSSYVHFMKAEAAMWDSQVGLARTHLETAMRHSFDKVLSFGSLDPNADANFFATQDEVDGFVDRILTQFDNAPGLDTSIDNSTLNNNFGYPVNKSQLDILGEQYIVAMFGGAMDAWNFIRRTGHPRTLTYGLMDQSESGPFPRTGTYPFGEVSANPNITQREDTLTRVFWDTEQGTGVNFDY